MVVRKRESMLCGVNSQVGFTESADVPDQHADDEAQQVNAQWLGVKSPRKRPEK